MDFLHQIQRRALRQALQSRPGVFRQYLRQISHSSQQPFRTRPSQASTLIPKASKRQFASWSPFPRSLRRPQKIPRRFQSTQAEPADQNLSLSQRLRKLSREYGWSALGVYLLLSALDFPFCFLAVNLLGTDRIGHWEHVVLSYIKGAVKWPLPQEAQQQVDGASDQVKTMIKEKVPVEEVRKDEKRLLEEDHTYVVEDHGYREAEEAASHENASLWTQLVLAYAIHKSFIFVRVPLTAAVLPKVVKTLRSWGWNIGKMPARKGAAARGSGINTQGTGVKPN